MLAYDPNLATIFGMNDVVWLYVSYFIGILPYIHFERDLAALPYMTRDFIKMKFEERRIAASLGKKAFLTIYIYLVQVCNITFNPVLIHL